MYGPPGCKQRKGVNKEREEDKEFGRRTVTGSELRERMWKMTPRGGEEAKQRKQERRQKERQNAAEHRHRIPLECSRTTYDPNTTKKSTRGRRERR